MTSSETSSKPLPLTPPVWWMLGLVALLLVARLWNDYTNGRDASDSIPLSITRHQGSEHRFYSLGIEVDLPPEWVYLAWIDDARANQLTFAHPPTNSIVRIIPNVLDQWPPTESTPFTTQPDVDANRSGEGPEKSPGVDSRVTHRQYEHAQGEWVPLTRRVRIPSLDVLGNDTVYLWQTTDHRRLGRLYDGDQDVLLIAMTHRHKASLNDAVHRLCDSIEFIGAPARMERGD